MPDNDPTGYEPPSGFGDPRPPRALATDDDLSEAGARPPAPPRRTGSSFSSARVILVVALIAVGASALLGYRAYHRSRVLAEGTAVATLALRLDTAAGYRLAADTLEPLARLDPHDAASMRAFALAMLATDYREAALAGEVEALISEPGQAERVPAYANLAAAALHLGRGAVGDSATFAGRASSSPWSGPLMARLTMMAGNAEGAFEPLQRSLAIDGHLPASLAMQGDLYRRVRRDSRAARGSYVAALEGSRTHPRATFGLAKLALASQIPANEAMLPLRALLHDTLGTPGNERARAALHLAALELRAGDRAAAGTTLDAIEGIDPASRSWAGLAALIASSDRHRYRAVKAPPALFVSASDDDPLEAPAVDPTPPPRPKATPRLAPTPARKPAAPAKKAPARKPAASHP